MDLVQHNSSASVLTRGATTNAIQDTWANSTFLWSSAQSNWSVIHEISLSGLMPDAKLQAILVSDSSQVATQLVFPNDSSTLLQMGA